MKPPKIEIYLVRGPDVFHSMSSIIQFLRSRRIANLPVNIFAARPNQTSVEAWRDALLAGRSALSSATIRVVVDNDEQVLALLSPRLSQGLVDYDNVTVRAVMNDGTQEHVKTLEDYTAELESAVTVLRRAAWSNSESHNILLNVKKRLQRLSDDETEKINEIHGQHERSDHDYRRRNEAQERRSVYAKAILLVDEFITGETPK